MAGSRGLRREVGGNAAVRTRVVEEVAGWRRRGGRKRKRSVNFCLIAKKKEKGCPIALSLTFTV
jgi:hypothetical protein